MTAEDIKNLGVKATQEIWELYKENFDDPAMKKNAYDMVAYCLNSFKAHIPNMQTETYWHRPHDYLLVHEILRRLMIEYVNIDDMAWSEEFKNRFGGDLRSNALQASESESK